MKMVNFFINFLNASDSLVMFYLWQKPPVCSEDVKVYTNCIFYVGGGPSSGEWQEFWIASLMVGAQLQASPLSMGRPSGGPVSAQRLNNNTLPSDDAPNATNLITSPLGFSPEYFNEDVPAGACRIVAPSSVPDKINVGVAFQFYNQPPVLSNFWEAEANQVIDFELPPVYYLTKMNIGEIETGFIVDIEAALVGAAVCDFSASPSLMVTYHGESNPGGCWTIEPGQPQYP